MKDFFGWLLVGITLGHAVGLTPLLDYMSDSDPFQIDFWVHIRFGVHKINQPLLVVLDCNDVQLGGKYN